MRRTHPVTARLVLIIPAVICLQNPSAPIAAEARSDPGAHPELVVRGPAATLGVVAERPEAIPGFAARAREWRGFSRGQGGPWDVWLDRRSGVPLLVQGAGLPFPAGPGATGTRPPEAQARDFLTEHRSLFGMDPAELVLNEEGSGATDPDHSVLVFDRVIGGLPVEGDQVRLHLVRGRLVAFGATSWALPPDTLDPVLTAEQAVAAARAHMGAPAGSPGAAMTGTSLVLLPVPEGEAAKLRPAWRVDLAVATDPATWVARVDAATGKILSFEDETQYDTLRGGVYPITNDGDCPEGCEQSFPMPWTEMENGGEATSMGRFFCAPGNPAATALQGAHVQRFDGCGELFETSACGLGFDLGTSPGTDCAVAPGASPGNTAASRTAYYHLNRAQEKGRYWLFNLVYPIEPLFAFVNYPGFCNAFYNGIVGFNGSGAGCANTAEIGSVVVHEWAHGLDARDGGGFDVPTEAYADVAAVIQTRRSCVGENFTPGRFCSGFGDTCLSCTGVREMDWERRAAATPATPANFILPLCPGGTGACGRSQHCESHVVTEAIYDLATRDLPAMGIDPATAWQITERLFYTSRQGSGGRIFNCALPASSGCGAGNWFTRFRVADDEDGNLVDGTPHAGAIFAAFDRHGIACGTAADVSNQSQGGCEALTAPELAATADPGGVNLSWSAVPGATGYRVLRTEVSCDYSQNAIAETTAGVTAHRDRFPPQDLAMHYRVQPLGERSSCDGPVSNCHSVAAHGFEGRVSLDRDVYACDATVLVTVYDGNIGAEGAEIRSTLEPGGELLTLVEEVPLTALHVGRIQLTADPSPQGDGLLRAGDGDTLTVRYVDRDDGLGGVDVVREATAQVDCSGPPLLDLSVRVLSETFARVTWRTAEPATTRVRWGEIDLGEHEHSDQAFVTEHAVILSGLRRCTRYLLEVSSRDGAGNTTTGEGPGAESFETPGNFGQGLQQCHRGVVQLDRPAASCDGKLLVRLTDLDLNLHPDLHDAARLQVTSTSEAGPETAFLRETGRNTSTFTGSLLTGPGPAVAGDRRLQVAHGDLLTASYSDTDDGTGTARTAFATGVADCFHDGIVSVQVTPASDSRAVVRWTTAEPATGLLEWGTSPDDLRFALPRIDLLPSHEAVIEPLEECGRIYFRIQSTDAYGNKASADADPAPLEFSGVAIPGVLYSEGFEKAEGWTLPGEWEVGSPGGTGFAGDDPKAALFGVRVLGHDLSGLGLVPRRYEPFIDESATSPFLDATLLHDAQLLFYRYLNTGPLAPASVEVLGPSGWVRVWSEEDRSATAWSREVVDIAPWADGNPSLRIRFRQETPATLDGRGGWNVDRLVVRDGSQPPFVACGGCGGAPSMVGILRAEDLDPCAASGIAITWSGAVSWGTGRAGTYAVYRGTKAGFQPSPASLLAAGVAATSWIDPAPPPDTDLYYLVRAENDEPCGAGPFNGGLTDGNLRYVPARDATSQPAPGAVGSGLEARNAVNAHVQLAWDEAANATAYNVYRAAGPRGPFLLIGSSAGSFFEDAGAGGAALPGFYIVRAADACGNEGP